MIHRSYRTKSNGLKGLRKEMKINKKTLLTFFRSVIKQTQKANISFAKKTKQPRFKVKKKQKEKTHEDHQLHPDSSNALSFVCRATQDLSR